MSKNPTYEELKQRVKALEKEAANGRRAQKELERKITELNSFTNNIPDMAWIKDVDSCFVVVNSAFGETVEMDPRSLTHQTCDVCFGKEEAKKFREDDLEVMKGRKQVIIEEKIIDAQKNEIWLETIKSPILDESGKIAGTVGIARDISKRKQVEDELRNSQERFEILFELAPDAYYLSDLKGNFVAGNIAAEELVGYKKEELTGKNFLELKLLPPTQTPRAVKLLAQNALGKRTGPDEFTLNRKDGNQVIAEIRTHPVKIEGHSYVLGIARDITKRKWAEEALREAHEDLERKVKERTAELVRRNEQLKHETKERKQAEIEKRRFEAQFQNSQKMEAIGTLAGGIAHDFNNLLMAIHGNVSLMLYDIDSAHPHHERLNHIEEQIGSGTKLTGQLLGYARKGRYEVKTLDLNQLVKETIETFCRARKEITGHQDFAEDLSAIKADRGQIEQAILNICVNAWQAMPAGGDLFVKTTNTTHENMKDRLYRPKTGNYVLLEVIDTGTGMDEKTKERIFEPFFTTKGMGQGTGLGLASVYGIIKGHDGYIDVKSERGNGTAFKIYLPASARRVNKTNEVAKDIIEGSGIILLVDDEERVLDISSEMLKKLGYTVLEARGGREAVEVYKKHKGHIDMVILDMIMPGLDGGAAYDKMKKINANAKVLLSSGYSLEDRATEIMKRGCDGFIQKPFNLRELSEKIREILAKE